jgi:hypothetical protein
MTPARDQHDAEELDAQLDLDAERNALVAAADHATRLPRKRALVAAAHAPTPRRATVVFLDTMEAEQEPVSWQLAQLAEEAYGLDQFGDPYFTAADVVDWLDRAEAMGATRPVIGAETIGHLFTRTLVPNAQLRARYEELHELGLATASGLARQLGHFKTKDKSDDGDASRVERMLGALPSSPDKHGNRSLRLFVDYGQATALATALGMDPHSLGI